MTHPTPPTSKTDPSATPPTTPTPTRKKTLGKRLLHWTLALLASLALLLVLTLAGGLFYLRSDTGQAQLTGLLTQALKVAGIEAHIGSLRGPLPETLILHDVQLSDAHGVWLDVPEATLGLRLISLLHGHLTVRELIVRAPVLWRIPEFPAAAPESPSSDPLASVQTLSSVLPSVLSRITLEKLHVDTLRIGAPVLALSTGEPPLTLSLAGSGPLTDWQGTLDALLTPFEKPAVPAETPKTLHVTGTLRLGNQGDWLATAVDAAIRLDLAAKVTPVSPETQPLTLHTLLTLNGTRLALAELDAVLPGGSVRVHDLSASSTSVTTTPAAPLSAVAVTGTLNAELENPATLSAHLNALLDVFHLSLPPVPCTSASAQGVLTGSLNDPNLALELGITGLSTTVPSGTPVPATTQPVPPDFTTHLQLTLASAWDLPVLRASGDLRFAPRLYQQLLPPASQPVPDLVLTLTAEAQQERDALRLHRLELRSDLATLSATGSFAPETGALTADTRLELPDLRQLEESPLLASFVAQQNVPQKTDRSGKAELLLTARREPASPLTGSMQLRLSAMRWGVPQLQGLLGATAEFGFGFQIQPETHPDQTLPDLTLQDVVLNAGQLTGKGRLRLYTAPPTATVRATSPGLDMNVTLGVKSLAQLDAGLEGSAELRLNAQGPLFKPQVTLSLTSPRLRLNEAVLDSLKAELHTPAFTVATKTAEGTLRVSTQLRTPTTAIGTQATLSTAWVVRPESATVRDFTLATPGLRVTAALESRFPATAAPRLDGTLTIALDNGTTLAAFTGLPLHKAKGHAKLVLNARNKTQQLAADWSLAALENQDMTLRNLSGRLMVNNLFGKPDLNLKATLEKGKYADLRWTEGSLSATGPLHALLIAAKLQGRTNADLALTLNLPAQTAQVARLELAHAQMPRSGIRAKLPRGSSRVGLRLNQPVTLSFAHNKLSVDKLDLSVLPQGTIQARINTQGTLLNAQLRDLTLAMARPFLTLPVPDGILNADILLNGSSRPQGNLTLTLDKVAYPQSELPPVNAQLRGQIQNSPTPQFIFEATLAGLGETPLTAALTLPLQFVSGLPELASSRPLSGSVRWDGPLAPLWQFVPLANSSLTGQGHIDVALSGTPKAPLVSASLQLLKAEFEDILLGLLLTDINADVQLNTQGTRLSLSAQDGQGGTLDLGGTIGTFAAGLPLHLAGTVKTLSPLHRKDLDLTLTGSTLVSGPLAAPEVQADITVTKGMYQIVPSFGTAIPTLDVQETEAFTPQELFGNATPATGNSTAESVTVSGGPHLNVRITVPNRFFVRGSGLESEWKGELRATGPVTAPVLTGGLSSIRGQLSLLGKQFALTKGLVTFSGGTPPDPSLDIVVSYNAANITAQATLSGTATSPVLTLSSQPPLPQDEVVAQVLFGQSASSLGRMEAIQLAGQLAMLAGFGSQGPGLLDKTREALGIDVLRIGSIQREQTQQQTSRPGLLQPGQSGPSGQNAESDSGSIPALEVGKYVLDDVYVGLEQGMNGDTGGVRVEVELTPNINLEGSTTPQGSRIGANWKKDY